MSSIQAEFDQIALLAKDEWDHNSHYHSFLLNHAPPHCAQALEIGCGAGAFARLLAQRSDRVLALDLSPQMVRIARERSASYLNIEFRVTDVTTTELGGPFDCIASIATMHHLPFDEMLERSKCALRPGGTLLLLDLYQAQTLADKVVGALAFPSSGLLKLAKLHRLRESEELRAAWDRHGRNDIYITLAQVRDACARLLPGARVTRHLFWRYSIVWRKPLE